MSGASPTLDAFWAPRRALTLSAARRHTRRIQIFRFGLILMAGALLGLVAFYLVRNAGGGLNEEVGGTEAIRMTNPRYTGLDGDGTPYSLTADFATRDISESNVVDLSKPVLKFQRKPDALPSTVTADRGEYDSTQQVMILLDNVVVTTDDGYVCKTSHARIYAAKRTVEGDQAISCTGNFGVMRGDRYEILDDYSRFIFQDNVKATLYPDRMRGEGEEPVVAPEE